MESSSGRFSLWSVLVIVATVGSAAAGAAWQVGRSRIQDELEQYRRSADLNLPKTLQEMRELSSHLSMSLEEKKQLEQVPQLRAQNDELRKELENANQSIEAARKTLAETEGGTFTLAEGKTHTIVPGKLVLGVGSASYNTCSVRLGKESNLISLGEPIDAVEGKISYRIILLETEQGRTCKFSLSREDKK